jgi:hypothetical protein
LRRRTADAARLVVLQAVPMTIAGTEVASPVVYEWQSSRDLLVAAGGTTPTTAHLWNLEREMCQGEVRPPCQLPPCTSCRGQASA